MQVKVNVLGLYVFKNQIKVSFEAREIFRLGSTVSHYTSLPVGYFAHKAPYTMLT